MVGILISFWDGPFSGAMLVSGRVFIYSIHSRHLSFHNMISWDHSTKPSTRSQETNESKAFVFVKHFWLGIWGNLLSFGLASIFVFISIHIYGYGFIYSDLCILLAYPVLTSKLGSTKKTVAGWGVLSWESTLFKELMISGGRDEI